MLKNIQLNSFSQIKKKEDRKVWFIWGQNSKTALLSYIETSIKLTASWGMAAGEAQEQEGRGRGTLTAIAFGCYISSHPQ